MNNKFDSIIFSYIEENINVDPNRLKQDLQRLSASLPVQTKKALEATSSAMVGATETNPIDAAIDKLKDPNTKDEEKAKILMDLIDKKNLPDITQRYQKPETSESDEEEKETTQLSSIQKPIKKTPLTPMSTQYKAPI
jgi:hypothetical protein